MVLPSYRLINLAQAVAGAALIVIAIVYFQNYLGLEPCYLCITQRVFVIAVAVICAIAALHNPGQKGQRTYAGLSIGTGSGRLFFWQTAVAAKSA